MSFCFNFPVPESDKREEENEGPTEAKRVRKEEENCKEINKNNCVTPAQEIKIQKEQWDDIEDFDVDQHLEVGDGVSIKYVHSGMAEQAIRESGSKVKEALDQDSDLVPDVYEGGLKIWECSVDLAEYLASLKIAFRGLKVLELGCGAGLPGLYTLMQGAKVHFQDYNPEVLEHITVPNVLLNVEESVTDGVRFLAGDWVSVNEQLSKERKAENGSDDRYDMILTSETIYNLQSQQSLLGLMEAVLKPQGVVYLAAKTHYFGVGGGVRQFEEKVKQDGVFSSEVVKEITGGVNREILKLKFLREASETEEVS